MMRCQQNVYQQGSRYIFEDEAALTKILPSLGLTNGSPKMDKRRSFTTLPIPPDAASPVAPLNRVSVASDTISSVEPGNRLLSPIGKSSHPGMKTNLFENTVPAPNKKMRARKETERLFECK